MPETITNEITEYINVVREKIEVLKRMKNLAKTTHAYDDIVDEMDELTREYNRLIKKQIQK